MTGESDLAFALFGKLVNSPAFATDRVSLSQVPARHPPGTGSLVQVAILPAGNIGEEEAGYLDSPDQLHSAGRRDLSLWSTSCCKSKEDSPTPTFQGSTHRKAYFSSR